MSDRKTAPLCADCKTHPAVLKRGKEVVCTDCYNEKPLAKPGEWDRVIRPTFITALEARLAQAETRIAVLESIISQRTADS